MKKITCDKCGAELNEQTTFPIVIGGKVVESFDLCGDCREALIDWLADGAPVEAFFQIDDVPLDFGNAHPTEKYGCSKQSKHQTEHRQYERR